MEEYQKELDNIVKELGWDYWTPHEMLASIIEETGELARLVNYLHGPKVKKDSEAQQHLEEEIGDILLSVMFYANGSNINLDKAIRKSLDKVIARDKGRFNQK